MAKHNDHEDHNNLQPEDSGIKASPVLLFLGILAVATAITFGIVWGVLYGLKKFDTMNKPQPATDLPEGQARKLPPEPRLQGAPDPKATDGKSLLPQDDLEKYHKEINERAESYGWVDKNGGIAR